MTHDDTEAPRINQPPPYILTYLDPDSNSARRVFNQDDVRRVDGGYLVKTFDRYATFIPDHRVLGERMRLKDAVEAWRAGKAWLKP